jgi:hypothetical protein
MLKECFRAGHALWHKAVEAEYYRRASPPDAQVELWMARWGRAAIPDNLRDNKHREGCGRSLDATPGVVRAGSLGGNWRQIASSNAVVEVWRLRSLEPAYDPICGVPTPRIKTMAPFPELSPGGAFRCEALRAPLARPSRWYDGGHDDREQHARRSIDIVCRFSPLGLRGIKSSS